MQENAVTLAIATRAPSMHISPYVMLSYLLQFGSKRWPQGHHAPVTRPTVQPTKLLRQLTVSGWTLSSSIKGRNTRIPESTTKHHKAPQSTTKETRTPQHKGEADKDTATKHHKGTTRHKHYGSILHENRSRNQP